MYSEILLPTDGGPASAAAIDHAVELAAETDARLHGLYVLDTTAYPALDAGREAVLGALKEEGREALEGVTDAAEDAGVAVVSELISETPHRGIIEYATDNDIDLIVMGTHGRTGLDRYLLGSVTERIVRTSEIPVLTVRAPEDDT
ncbi:MAG: universal stress protein [Euryarchaeota archaeon]|nr:universal stress protein [Euryarchaeota archaeon]